MELRKIIGINIRTRRELFQWTLKYVAAEVGIHYSYLSKVEKGDAELRFTTIRRVARLFCCTTEELCLADGYTIVVTVTKPPSDTEPLPS